MTDSYWVCAAMQVGVRGYSVIDFPQIIDVQGCPSLEERDIFLFFIALSNYKIPTENWVLHKCSKVFSLSFSFVLYSLWPSLCSRSQIKYQQTGAINKDTTGVKSLTAVRDLLNVISYGTDAKANAVLSYFIIGNYSKSGLCNSSWKGGVLLMTLETKTKPINMWFQNRELKSEPLVPQDYQ